MLNTIEKRNLASQIVRRHGTEWNAHQILNPGFTYWIDPRLEACAAYVQTGEWWVVGGAPVAEADRVRPAAVALQQAARDAGRGVCFVCVSAEAANRIASSESWARLCVGAEPVWTPADWADMLKRRPSVRAQLRRATNKGVVIREIDANASARDGELRGVVRQWLDRHGLPPMRFLVEPNLFSGEMGGRVVLVARRAGKAVGVLVASPVAGRNGYLIELIARGENAPNGMAELLIDAAMQALGDRGAIEVSLGVVALSTHAPELARNAWWIRLFTRWALAHGRRFYHFDGLEKFREKLRPTCWEPVYVVTSERAVSLSALYAVAHAFCGGPPASMLARAMIKAASQEFKWARARARDVLV